MAATPIAGTPLARKPRPGPEPTATSRAPAASACCIWASPRNADTASSTFSCCQILASVPTSAVLNANELGTDFPTRILSSAKAARDDRIKGAARVPATTLRRDTTLRLERVRIIWSPELRTALLPTVLSFSRANSLGVTTRHCPQRRCRNCDTPAPSSHEEYKDISKLLRYSCISTCHRFRDGPCRQADGARPAWLEHRDSRSA